MVETARWKSAGNILFPIIVLHLLFSFITFVTLSPAPALLSLILLFSFLSFVLPNVVLLYPFRTIIFPYFLSHSFHISSLRNPSNPSLQACPFLGPHTTLSIRNVWNKPLQDNSNISLVTYYLNNFPEVRHHSSLNKSSVRASM